MSRRFPKATTEDKTAAEAGGLPGGGEGIKDPNDGSMTIHFAGKTENEPAPAPSPEVAVKPARYRVMGPGPSRDGSWPVLYNGLRVDMRPGKVFDDASYDVQKIRDQGVKLEELAD